MHLYSKVPKQNSITHLFSAEKQNLHSTKIVKLIIHKQLNHFEHQIRIK
jgi:hypothetical protein